MTEVAANLLIRKIERERRWPPSFDHDHISDVARLAAFREADEPTLRSMHDWPQDRNYVIDPIGDRIASAKADLLFAEDPRIRPKEDDDAENLKRIERVSDLATELHYAEQVRASEGEVWGRVKVDPTVTEAPQITWHSREQVVPLFVGNALIAIAFVSEFIDPAVDDRSRPVIWRLLEIHTRGRVENRLYKGWDDNIGEAQDLDAFPETEDLETAWEHPVDAILADRVIFRRGRTRALGRSVYQGVEAVMLALNEAMTIGVENARLVAKSRAVVPEAALTQNRSPFAGLPDSLDMGDGSRIPIPRPSFDAGEDLLVVGSLDASLGKEAGSDVFKILEYTFDASALVAWQDKLVQTLASRCGLTVAFLGEGQAAGEGQAETGTALRVRLLPATSSARGSSRPWSEVLPRLLMYAQLIDAAPTSAGGFARPWRAAGEAPSVELEDPLPRDVGEDVTRHVAAVGGPVESIETAVRDLHPDWSNDQIDEEVGRIREDVQTASPFAGLGGTPPPKPNEDPPPTPPGPGAE